MNISPGDFWIDSACFSFDFHVTTTKFQHELHCNTCWTGAQFSDVLKVRMLHLVSSGASVPGGQRSDL